MIKAITFDLWNTLIWDRDYLEQRVECLANVMSKTGIARNRLEIKEAYAESHNYAHSIWENEHYRRVTSEERLNHILVKLLVSLPQHVRGETLNELEELVMSDPPLLIEGTKETLVLLSPTYRVGLVSDTGMTPGRILRRVLSRHGILRFFQVTIFSDEIGYSKPHRDMFETALRGLKAEPFESIHVGDSLQTDVAGAKGVGMKAVWLNKHGRVSGSLVQPDYEIRALSEILHVLKNERGC